MNQSTMALGAASVLLLCAAPAPAPEKMDLTDAVKQKKVSLTATATGGNSEECIDLKLKNISGKPLRISIAPGTLFDSSVNSEQDILVTRESEAILAANQTSTAKAYGFCCQLHNALPNKGNTYSAVACTNPRLKDMAEFLGKNKYDVQAQQSAVWAVSDNLSAGGIYGDGKELDSLRNYAALLAVQDKPFYQVDYGYSPNTQFVYAPKTLEGNMDFFLEKNGKATLVVYDPNGEPFQVFYTDKRMTTGNYSQHFRYTATNMMPGEYRVRMLLDNALVCERKITL